MVNKIIIDPTKEVTPTQYKNFKRIAKQTVNNWLYRDKKLTYRTIPEYNLVLIQIPEHEREAYKDYLKELQNNLRT